MDAMDLEEIESGIDSSEVTIDSNEAGMDVSVLGRHKVDGEENEIFFNVMKRLVECDEEHDRTVFYLKGHSKEPFNKWLDSHLPSKLDRERCRIEWIYVAARLLKSDRNAVSSDPEGLLLSWQKYIRSGRPITFQSIVEQAGNYNVTTGKWMFFAETGPKIDILWLKIATGILGDNQSVLCDAKVSTFHEDNWRHVVCIYNRDFRNKDEVLQLERAIRELGIKCQLKYKPDVYTYIGVYTKNPWGFKPTIFESVFDITTRKSIITSDVFEV